MSELLTILGCIMLTPALGLYLIGCVMVYAEGFKRVALVLGLLVILPIAMLTFPILAGV